MITTWSFDVLSETEQTLLERLRIETQYSALFAESAA